MSYFWELIRIFHYKQSGSSSKSFVGDPFSSRSSSHEELPSRLFLMGASTGANGSCCRVARKFLLRATRLLHMKAPIVSFYLKLFEGSKWELLREHPWSS